MKKITALVLSAIILVSATSVLLYSIHSSNEDLFSSNVEALAETEGGSIFGPMCSKTGQSGNYRMKLCSKCNGQFGNYDMDFVAYCTK